VFQEARSRQESSIKVSISYVEIYNEMMYDLLATLPDDHTSSMSNPLIIAEVSTLTSVLHILYWYNYRIIRD